MTAAEKAAKLAFVAAKGVREVNQSKRQPPAWAERDARATIDAYNARQEADKAKGRA